MTDRKNHVSIAWSVIGTFVPFVCIWMYARINKFWLGLLINAVFVGLFIGCILLTIYIEFPDPKNIFAIIFRGMLLIVGLGTYLFGHIPLMVYWCRNYNKSVDEFNSKLDSKQTEITK